MYFHTTLKDANGINRSRGDKLPEGHELSDHAVKHYMKQGWLSEDEPEMPKEAAPVKGGGGRQVQKDDTDKKPKSSKGGKKE